MAADTKTRDAEERADDREVDKEGQQSNKQGVASSNQKRDSVRNPDRPDPVARPTAGAYGDMDRESVSETEPAGAPALDED